eukprot:2885954-Rhodomonas_salina.1
MARGDASAVVEVASSHAVNSPSLDVGDVRAGRKLVVDGRVELRNGGCVSEASTRPVWERKERASERESVISAIRVSVRG